MGLFGLFLATAAPAKGLFPKVVKELSAPPAAVPAGASALQEDLIRTFAEEKREILAALPKGTEKKEKLRRVSAALERKNFALRDALTAEAKGTSPLEEKTLREIYTQLATNRVSKVDAVGKYDGWGNIGFCFGRAMMVHYLFLKKGLAQENLAKIFAVGKLKYDDRPWDFHMATIARGNDGNWWVVDSLFDKPLPHAEWMKRAMSLAFNKTFPEVRFYVSDVRKFQPAYGAYRVKDLAIPELKPYFEALFTTLASP